MNMITCNIIEIETPKKVRLNGLWFGTKKPVCVIVWVHGLGSSAFSRQGIIELLAKGDTAVLAFNNRGHDTIAKITRGEHRFLAGATHEVFEECADDIQGAINFARRQKAKKIYLAGHSTGCQKSIYWAYKKKSKGIAGIILLAPIADYAGLSVDERTLVPKATKVARSLVAEGKSHDLLSNTLWSTPIDAQRFLSLYTPDSVEQSIFSYFDKSKTPRILRSVKVPILVLLAGKDEHTDRSAEEIAMWFSVNNRSHLFSVSVIARVAHNFKGEETKVTNIIKQWIQSTK